MAVAATLAVAMLSWATARVAATAKMLTIRTHLNNSTHLQLTNA